MNWLTIAEVHTLFTQINDVKGYFVWLKNFYPFYVTMQYMLWMERENNKAIFCKSDFEQSLPLPRWVWMIGFLKKWRQKWKKSMHSSTAALKCEWAGSIDTVAD